MTPSLALLLTIAAGPAQASQPASFAGSWKTTFGTVSLKQDGDAVTGSFGVNGQFPIKGKVTDNVLKMEYDEGQVKGDATFTLDPSGASYGGTFQIRGGRRGFWNGWRPDPAASEGKLADFSGLWLTDNGLMELSQDGDKVKGRYAIRGTTGIEGTAKGRHLDFRYLTARPGPGWFDLDKSGEAISGASGPDGPGSWSPWKGRKAPEYARLAPPVAGKLVDGSTSNLLTYTVRAPEGYRPGDGRKWPAIVILHGSNMNGLAYVNTIAQAWPEIARRYILLGINGESASNIAKDATAFNYTYVNFMGKSTYRGFPGTDRESPALVLEAMNELKKAYPIKSYFVGGHSQGGFLTYSLLMNSPEAIAGAFPISCGLIMQAEPSVFADEALKEAQRRVPLAIVHAKNDPVVSFSMSDDADKSFDDAGWPALRLFTNDRSGHMFALLPVDSAILWLEALTSEDPAKLLAFAESSLKEKRPRDAIAALDRARSLKLGPAEKAKADAIAGKIDAEAAPKARALLAKVEKNADGSWIDEFLAFRSDYGGADAAKGLMAAFGKLRKEQDAPAQKLINEALAAFNQGRRPDGFARAREIVTKYYASSSYRTAKSWLAEEK